MYARALVALPLCLLLGCPAQESHPPATYPPPITPSDSPSGTAPPIAGTWTLAEAHTPTGGQYTGTVSIAPQGAAYALAWQTSGGAYSGVGLFAGGRLHVGWGTGASTGIVVYHIRGDGSLDGSWTTPGVGGALGTELASGGTPGAVEGKYVVQGQNPGGGAAYNGTLEIARTGDVYHLYWNVGAVYKGTGLRDGEWLGVGWGTGGDFGFVLYAFEGNQAQGRWTVLGQSGIGVENLTR